MSDCRNLWLYNIRFLTVMHMRVCCRWNVRQLLYSWLRPGGILPVPKIPCLSSWSHLGISTPKFIIIFSAVKAWKGNRQSNFGDFIINISREIFFLKKAMLAGSIFCWFPWPITKISLLLRVELPLSRLCGRPNVVQCL